MNRKLRKMRKIELLEMLLEQEKEIETLREENAALKASLEDKRVKVESAGSIAEAALSLSGVFEAAQKAAEIYLASVMPESEITEDTETTEVTDVENNETIETEKEAEEEKESVDEKTEEAASFD